MTMIYSGLSGAQAARAALAASSQNTANVMTPGYTRQGAILASVQPLISGAMSAGSGVSVAGLVRFSDEYKSLQMWRANSQAGQFSATQPYFSQLEQVLSDEQSSLNNGIDAFFSALNAASVEPTSMPLRQQVVASVESMAQRFNSLTQVMVNQRNSVMQQRIAMVQNVNDLSAQIAELNSQIAWANNSGANPSGLIDARDMRIDELSSLVGVQVVSQADGSRNVSLAGGQPLVLGGRSSTITVNYLPDGTQTLQLDFVNDTFSLVDVKLGGQLGGLDSFEYGKLVPMMQSVTALGQELTDRVNTQLAAGFAMDGSAGQPLFQFSVSGPIGTMSLNPAVTPDMLAFSGVATEQGNSQNLLALIAVKSQQITVPQLGTVMLSDAFSQLVSRLGMDSRKNQTSLDTAQTVRNQAEESWKSTSGVNLDEEATNLMQYQQMYQANMKVIAVANELFDSMLGMFN